MIADLRRAADALGTQWDKNPGSRFVLNALNVLKQVSRFMSDVDQHERRRTLPKTNSKSLTGYLYQLMQYKAVLIIPKYISSSSKPSSICLLELYTVSGYRSIPRYLAATRNSAPARAYAPSGGD